MYYVYIYIWEQINKICDVNSTFFLKYNFFSNRTNIGIRLLKKLGWKEGQGVGDRVKGKKPLSKLEIIKRKYTDDQVLVSV